MTARDDVAPEKDAAAPANDGAAAPEEAAPLGEEAAVAEEAGSGVLAEEGAASETASGSEEGAAEETALAASAEASDAPDETTSEDAASAEMADDEAAAIDGADVAANENAANENASPRASKPEVPQDPETLRQVAEAMIFASTEPLSEKVLADRLPSGTDIRGLLSNIASAYATRGIRLVRIGDCWAFRTAPELAPHLQLERKVTRKLSRAALEALGIVAYHQPVTRAEIEEIRGVALSRGTLDVLLEANWIKPGKRRRTPGRPLTWVTTQEFLDHFSLEKIEDLPGLDELKASGLLDPRPRVHVLEPGRTEEEPEGDAEASEELQPLELDESEIAAEDEDAPPSRPDPAR